jgi:hypothetical protein
MLSPRANSSTSWIRRSRRLSCAVVLSAKRTRAASASSGCAEIGAVEQGRCQRGAQLVRQRSRHLAHCHQALVTFQFGLEAVRCRHIVDQQDSSPGRIERTLDDRQAARLKLPLVRRLGRHQPGLHQRRPGFADDRLTEHLAGRRVGLADTSRAVEHHHPGRQGVEQQRQTFGKRFLLLVLPAQLAIGNRQFGRQGLDTALQPLVGLGQRQRNLVEGVESPLQFLRFEFMARCRTTCSSNGKSRAINSYNSREIISPFSLFACLIAGFSPYHKHGDSRNRDHLRL